MTEPTTPTQETLSPREHDYHRDRAINYLTKAYWHLKELSKARPELADCLTQVLDIQVPLVHEREEQ